MDLEYARTASKQLFTPPTWITGHGLGAVDTLPHGSLYPNFFYVLETQSLNPRPARNFELIGHPSPMSLFPPPTCFENHPVSLVYNTIYLNQDFPGLFRCYPFQIIPKIQRVIRLLQQTSIAGWRSQDAILNILEAKVYMVLINNHRLARSDLRR
jgi:hypothetical protein